MILNTLSKITNYTELPKRRILINAIFKAQFNYCPVIWMFHSRSLNNKINRLHERCLRIIYNDEHSNLRHTSHSSTDPIHSVYKGTESTLYLEPNIWEQVLPKLKRTSLLMVLTLFRMGLFGAVHGWGGQKGPPSLKPVTHILQ